MNLLVARGTLASALTTVLAFSGCALMGPPNGIDIIDPPPLSTAPKPYGPLRPSTQSKFDWSIGAVANKKLYFYNEYWRDKGFTYVRTVEIVAEPSRPFRSAEEIRQAAQCVDADMPKGAGLIAAKIWPSGVNYEYGFQYRKELLGGNVATIGRSCRGPNLVDLDE